MGRDCPYCGGALGFSHRHQQKTNGHHVSVYECGECGRTVVGG